MARTSVTTLAWPAARRRGGAAHGLSELREATTTTNSSNTITVVMVILACCAGVVHTFLCCLVLRRVRVRRIHEPKKTSTKMTAGDMVKSPSPKKQIKSPSPKKQSYLTKHSDDKSKRSESSPPFDIESARSEDSNTSSESPSSEVLEVYDVHVVASPRPHTAPRNTVVLREHARSPHISFNLPKSPLPKSPSARNLRTASI